MQATARTIEDIALTITREVRVRATPEATFAALLEQMGPYNETHDGKPLPMKIEPWPGGRWYRDLGGDDGHFWGMCRLSNGPRCSKSPGHYSCLFRFFQMCSTA
jgi:hypothetical protein